MRKNALVNQVFAFNINGNCYFSRKSSPIGNLLMVVGGQSDNSSSTDKGYVISLDDRVSIPSCLEFVCDFRYYFHYASTAILDGLPTICGGQNFNDDGETRVYHNECYKFNFSNAWTPAGSKSYAVGFTGLKSYPIFASHSFLPHLLLKALHTMRVGAWSKREVITIVSLQQFWIKLIHGRTTEKRGISLQGCQKVGT